MSSETKQTALGEVIEVTDYVANGSFAALKDNVRYLDHGFAILVRLVDHNANWHGEHIYVDESAYRFLSKSSLVQGDIVIANVGANAGSVFRIPKLKHPATLGPNAVRVRPKTNSHIPIDTDFLYYYLSSPLGQNKLQSLITGSAQPKFNKTALRGLSLSIPDLPKQRWIAGTMLVIDDRITLLRETNKTLEAIAQAIFKSWFVDFDPVRAKMEGRRPEGMDEATAALFPDSFEESELGLVPKGWTPLYVSQAADIVKGKSYSSKDLVNSHDTALVTLKSFARGGGFRMDGFKPYSGTYKPNQIVSPGDLIVAYTDVTQAAELIGKPAIVVGIDSYTTLVASLDVGIIRPNESTCGRQFLYNLFRTDSFQSHALAHTSGTTVLHLAKEGVGSFRFAYPKPELTHKFEVITSSFAEQRQINSDKIRTLSALRDTLLPRLISGQLRLPEAQEQIENALP